MTVLPLVGLTLLVSYLIGAIPFGYLVARWRGVDILRQGSGNIGATNVGRVLGHRFGILVFLLDFVKGALPAAAAKTLALGSSVSPEELGVAAGLAAFLGHLFPIYLRFHGGKGVATGAGIIAVLLPVPALAAFCTWIAVVCATRYVSLSSMAAVVVLCIVRLLIPEPFAPANRTLTLFCLVAAALVVVRHRANIGRLLQGNENRLRNSPTMLTLAKIIHLLSLGLWFGSMAFFTFVVGLSLFNTFQALGARRDRPAWFPSSSQYAKEDPQVHGPTEQGVRLAGAAVGPIFTWYFLIQVVCGVLALATAVNWSWTFPGTIHKVRAIFLGVALVLVVIGWLVEVKVDQLRQPRNEAVDTFLQSSGPEAAAAKEAALKAKATFGAWHGVSLLLNFVTLALVAVALALAAYLPTSSGQPEASRQWAGGAGQKVDDAGPAAAPSVPPAVGHEMGTTP